MRCLPDTVWEKKVGPRRAEVAAVACRARRLVRGAGHAGDDGTGELPATSGFCDRGRSLPRLRPGFERLQEPDASSGDVGPGAVPGTRGAHAMRWRCWLPDGRFKYSATSGPTSTTLRLRPHRACRPGALPPQEAVCGDPCGVAPSLRHRVPGQTLSYFLLFHIICSRIQ